jgi:hypothetical protein
MSTSAKPTLPLTQPHLFDCLKVVLDLYKKLDVVDERFYPQFDELVASLEAQEAEVRERIATWSDEKEAEYVKSQETIGQAQDFFEKIHAADQDDIDSDKQINKEEFGAWAEHHACGTRAGIYARTCARAHTAARVTSPPAPPPPMTA